MECQTFSDWLLPTHTVLLSNRMVRYNESTEAAVISIDLELTIHPPPPQIFSSDLRESRDRSRRTKSRNSGNSRNCMRPVLSVNWYNETRTMTERTKDVRTGNKTLNIFVRFLHNQTKFSKIKTGNIYYKHITVVT